jgi:hypothetical protein
MTTLIGAPPVSIASADLMSLASPPHFEEDKFSQYEQILMKAEQQELQRRVKQRRGRDRSRGRGLTRARGEGQRGEG